MEQQKRLMGQAPRKNVPFIRSQLMLLESRRKWGVLYSLATITGILGIPGILSGIGEAHIITFIQQIVLLPLISLFMATGMYILNDLVDTDLDRLNRKNRPLSSGQVSRRQAWFFIIITNGVAILLSIITFNFLAGIISVLMAAIGILYSAPKIALMRRFVLKTLSIAIFYMLCALLGMTSSYSLNLVRHNPTVAVHTIIMLGIMIFVSSMLNDLGDVQGDKLAGRRTIPIVLGSNNAIKLMILLISSMAIIPWIFNRISDSTSLGTVASISLFGMLVISMLTKLQGEMKELDAEIVRKQHGKLFPLHLVLQSSLIINSLISSGELSIHQ